VVGATAATLIAMHAGFSATVLIAVAAYALAAVAAHGRGLDAAKG
jgi:hypothetical protein